MHKFLVALLLLLASQDVQVMTGPHRKTGAVAPCTPPSTTYRYAAYNPANQCNDVNGGTAGVACTTTGDTIDYFPSFNGVSNSRQDQTTQRPTYVTNAINGKPAAQFLQASSQRFFPDGPSIQSVSPITAYAVIKPLTHVAGSIFNCESGTAGCVQYLYNGTNMGFNNMNRATIAVGTHTLSTGTWYATIMTYDYTTGNAALYLCSSGSCISDGTGNLVTGAWGRDVTAIGGSVQAFFLDAQLAEAGWINSNATSNAAIATYVQCQYGI